MNHEYVNRVVDLTDPEKNIIYNMTVDEAKELVRSGDSEGVRGIDGQFSLFAVEGKTIRMARSIGRPATLTPQTKTKPATNLMPTKLTPY